MKRLLAMFLTVLLFLVACSSGPEGEQTGENGNDEKPVEYLDLGGAEIIFFTSWPQHYRPEEAFSAEGDAMRARLAEVEQNNNCVIRVGENTTGVLAQIQAALMAGDPAHICDLASRETYTLYKAGYLVPLEDISTIDLSDEKKWGPVHIRQHGIYNGLTYGVHRFNTWTNIPEADGIIIVNNEEIKEYNFENPYEMYEKKEWTWDNFEKMLADYTTASFDGTNPVMALNIQTIDGFMKMAIFSNGGEIAKMNEDGTYTFTATEPNALKAMEWVAKLKKEKYIENKIENFHLGKNLFAAAQVYIATSTSEGMKSWAPTFNMDDYFIINCPYGPDGVYGSSSGYVHDNRRLISIIESNDVVTVEDLGSILSQLNNPLIINDKPQTWQSYTGQQSLHYPDLEVPMMENIINGAHYDYSVHFGSQNAMLNTKLTAIFNGTNTAAAGMDAVKEALTTALNENAAQLEGRHRNRK